MHFFAVKAILRLGVQRPRLLGLCMSKGHKMSFPLLQKQLEGGVEKESNQNTIYIVLEESMALSDLAFIASFPVVVALIVKSLGNQLKCQ